MKESWITFLLLSRATKEAMLNGLTISVTSATRNKRKLESISFPNLHIDLQHRLTDQLRNCQAIF